MQLDYQNLFGGPTVPIENLHINQKNSFFYSSMTETTFFGTSDVEASLNKYVSGKGQTSRHIERIIKRVV